MYQLQRSTLKVVSSNSVDERRLHRDGLGISKQLDTSRTHRLQLTNIDVRFLKLLIYKIEDRGNVTA